MALGLGQASVMAGMIRINDRAEFASVRMTSNLGDQCELATERPGGKLERPDF